MIYSNQQLVSFSVLFILLMALMAVSFKYTSQYRSVPRMSNNENRRRPHILLVVADDLGYNDVGYHGSNIYTPNIDRLARSGVILENYYTQKVCTPTRGQLLSGRHEIYTGLGDVLRAPVPMGLPLDSPTIADKLKEAGYSTHMVGKWHIGFYNKKYLPTYRGFDSFFGIPTGCADHFTYHHKSRLNNRTIMEGVTLMDNESPANMTEYSGEYSTTLYSNKAKEIIQNHNSDEPLFVLLAFQAPHGPLQVPDEYLKRYNHFEGKRKIFAGMVTKMDEAIGEVVDTMKAKGMWKNTVLVFTSDNGGKIKLGGNNWPLRGAKGSAFEGGIRVPGFVHSVFLEQSVSRELMHVSDWFPTLVNLAGGNLNGTKPLSGFDQWETIRNGAKGPRTEILHSMGHYAPHQKPCVNAAIRMGDWKLIKAKPGNILMENRTIRLINIKEDPTESKDLSSVMPGKVNEMLQRIEHYRKQMHYQKYKEVDENASPALHDGFWLPWK